MEEQLRPPAAPAMIASYDRLRIYIEMDGQISDHQGRATSNQIYNITDPLVPLGAAGTMYLAYSFDGRTEIIGGSGNSVYYSLRVTHNIDNNGQHGDQLVFEERTVGPGTSGQTGTTRVTATVPFVYGEEFRITTSFEILTQSDQVYLPFNSSFILSENSTYEYIEAAFDESATLDAVYLPEGASITLNSATNFDLAPLVNFGVPVPLPPSLFMFVPAVLGVFYSGRKCRAT